MPDQAGHYVLKPSRRKLGRTLAFCIGCVLLSLLFLHHPIPQDRAADTWPRQEAKLWFMAAGGSFGTIMVLYRMATRGYDLMLDDTGFTLRTKHYLWRDVASGFRCGKGNKRASLFFSLPGHAKPGSIGNIYPMPTAELAAFLNAQVVRHLGGAATIPATLLEMPRAGRRTLPWPVWALIVALFIPLAVNGGDIAEFLWSVVSPSSYAAHLLDDYDLSNRAGHDPRFLPVLLARAQSGDKSGMYFMGDLYDPMDFTCETAVHKNAATAIYWYRKAVALDDEGAERNLGILYLDGVGVPQSDAEAASLFELSVRRHNDDIGDYELGVMLETGQGESQDLPRAVALERASTAQNNAQGETELGRIYAQGIGIKPDMEQAEKYWGMAATQGDSDAQQFLDEQERWKWLREHVRGRGLWQERYDMHMF